MPFTGTGYYRQNAGALPLVADWWLDTIPPSAQAFTWDRLHLEPLPSLARLTSLKFERGTLSRGDIAALTPSLRLLTSLKRLELPELIWLRKNPDTVSELSALSSSLAGLVSLEHLALGGAGLSAEDLNRMLPSLTALRHLDLRNNHLTSDIAPALVALRALTHLDLLYNDVWRAEEGRASVCATLSLLTGLVFLDLGGNGSGVRCDDSTTTALGHGMPQSLTYLSMTFGGLSTDGILAFVPGLQRLTALRLLNLSSNIPSFPDNAEARTRCMHALANCLERMPGLISLDLSDNNLGPACIPALVSGLQHLRNLQNLNLGGNVLTGAQALIDCLQHLQELRDLDLSINELGVSDAQRLAACLPCLPKFRELNLYSNSLGSAGFAALMGSLVDLPSLAKIDVRDNQVTGIAVMALAAALRATGRLQAMPALEHFLVGLNKLGDRSAKALAGCLEHMPNLKSLNLENIEFRDNGMTTLITAMLKMASLTVLDVSRNGLTSVTINAIRAAMERPGREMRFY